MYLQYDAILNEFRHGPTSDERNDALRSLGHAQDPALVKRTLTMPLSDQVKGQDIYLPLAALRSYPASVEAVWEWMKANWEELVARLPPGLSMLSTVVQLCTSGFTRQEHVEEIEKFFSTKSTKGFDQSLAQSLDSIRAKAKWTQRDGEDVRKWLQTNGYLQ